MLQRLNKSLAPQCLAAPDKENEQAGEVRESDEGAPEVAPSSTPAAVRKQKGSKRRQNKKSAQRPAADPTQNGQDSIQDKIDMIHMLRQSGPLLPTPMIFNQMRGIHNPPGIFVGPAPQPCGPDQYPRLPYTGPFNYPPPSLGYPLVPTISVRQMPFIPQENGPNDPRINHSPHAQFVPRNGPRRTSSPLPGPRRELQPIQNEEDYIRFIMRLEQGRLARPVPVPLCPLPPMPCKPIIVPVGYMPNGCYGPILPGMYPYEQYPGAVYHQTPQVPQGGYPGGIYTAPLTGSVMMTNV